MTWNQDDTLGGTFAMERENDTMTKTIHLIPFCFYKAGPADEPRDDKGRWTSGSGDFKGLAAVDHFQGLGHRAAVEHTPADTIPDTAPASPTPTADTASSTRTDNATTSARMTYTLPGHYSSRQYTTELLSPAQRAGHIANVADNQVDMKVLAAALHRTKNYTDDQINAVIAKLSQHTNYALSDLDQRVQQLQEEHDAAEVKDIKQIKWLHTAFIAAGAVLGIAVVPLLGLPVIAAVGIGIGIPTLGEFWEQWHTTVNLAEKLPRYGRTIEHLLFKAASDPTGTDVALATALLTEAWESNGLPGPLARILASRLVQAAADQARADHLPPGLSDPPPGLIASLHAILNRRGSEVKKEADATTDNNLIPVALPFHRFNPYHDDHGRFSSSPSFAVTHLGASSWLEKGARDYSSAHSIVRPSIDFDKIAVNPRTAEHIAAAYDSAPADDPRAHVAFAQMAKEVGDQYRYLTHDLGVKVDVTDSDPYPDVRAMQHDLTANHHISVLSTASTGHHPFFTDEQNDQFRAVHDAFGHAATGRGFDRHGEEAAWLSHSLMFSPLARSAMTTETRGQNSVLTVEHHGFPQQKVALLPDDYSTIPERELRYTKSVADPATTTRLIPFHIPIAPRHCIAGRAQRDRMMKDWNEDAHPRDDGGRFVEAPVTLRDAHKVVSQAVRNGGISWHPGTHSEPTSGYMVAVQGHSLIAPLPNPHDRVARNQVARSLAKFLLANKALFANNPNLYVGGWYDEAHKEFVWDPSEHMSDQDQATQSGRDRNQQSVWDVANGTEIPTGGTGDRDTSERSE